MLGSSLDFLVDMFDFFSNHAATKLIGQTCSKKLCSGVHVSEPNGAENRVRAENRRLKTESGLGG